ncbi:VOC family protein [Paractinoplanes globisporus]|uniref:VOC family protein n=1 Tax=Paractinoplanes globisporus TaxID=113565 RepID=A0ABW6WVE6_9ACTN|nr:VOC family protein [Actinoplanes globisporus]
MLVRWITGFLDSPTTAAERFWTAVTGTTLSARREGGTFATLVPERGDACLRVQVVGSGPPRAHVDLHVEDVAAATQEAVGLGASVVADNGEFVVLRSPAGIVFCLVPWHGEWVRPAAVRWPGGQRSGVDQLSLDIPAGDYEAEVGFWAGLTGWRLGFSSFPEFRFLSGGAGLPLRFLLQRIGGGAPGVHLDLACDGVDAEVERHRALGASVVRRVPGEWTTLRDPVGREYCVTGRAPGW